MEYYRLYLGILSFQFNLKTLDFGHISYSHAKFVYIVIGTYLVFISGEVKEDEVVDSNIMPYCSIEKQQKKSLGEMEQDFLQALQVLITILPFLRPFFPFI